MLKKLIKSVFIPKRNCIRYASDCKFEESDPGVKIHKLPNKIKVAVEERASPLTCVSLSVVTGSRYERVFNNGMTHFIEHMAFKGFQTMSKRKLEKAVKEIGARVTVHTARDLQVFSVTLPTEKTHFAVEFLHKIVCELDINNCDVLQERDNICRELTDADANPKQVVFDYLHATAFQGTPLSQTIIGTSENLGRFNKSMLNEFFFENYVPARICLASSGGGNYNKFMDCATPLFESLSKTPDCDLELGPNRFTGSQVVYRDDSMPFCHVAIAIEAPGTSSADYYKMVAMNYIMGSWDRSQGRDVVHAAPVARMVAINKLCERYRPFYIAYQDIGLWGVYFIADKWKLDEVLSHIQDQWMQLCTTVSATDLQRACNLAKLHIARRYNSVVWSSRDIGRQLLLCGRRKSLKMVYKELGAVQVKEVRGLAHKYLYDKCPVVASVGPSETLPDYVRIRSGMYWLRL